MNPSFNSTQSDLLTASLKKKKTLIHSLTLGIREQSVNHKQTEAVSTHITFTNGKQELPQVRITGSEHTQTALINHCKLKSSIILQTVS